MFCLDGPKFLYILIVFKTNPYPVSVLQAPVRKDPSKSLHIILSAFFFLMLAIDQHYSKAQPTAIEPQATENSYLEKENGYCWLCFYVTNIKNKTKQN